MTDNNYNDNSFSTYPDPYENANRINTDTDNLQRTAPIPRQQPTGAYNEPQRPQEPQKPKKSHHSAALIAAVAAVALIIGGSSGFVGTMLANNVNTIKLPEASVSDTAEPSGGNDSSAASKPAEPVSTIDVSGGPTSAPALDSNKINDVTNSTLLTAAELYEKVKNTVVVLYNYKDVRGSEEPVLAGYASGVVFTNDGYIVTNAHVVSGASKITAVIPDYNDPEQTHEYEATILGSDTATDLAVIKVTRDAPFEYALLGNSDNVRVGEDVCVLGNPRFLVSSLTKGIVSGLGRASYSGSTYGCSSIQIDAAINGGNSGGGLFDMYGNVIGIIDYKMVSTSSDESIENLGFAITINEAKPVINDLMTMGYVTNRPGIGINGGDITEYTAYMYGIDKPGVYVTYINPDKPVANSDLRIGDIITAVNDTDISTVNDIQTAISNYKIGETVELTVYRQNEIGQYRMVKVAVELSELELN